jgi:hypothetical protein
MIVNGFCREVFKELPMEFAVEAQRLFTRRPRTCLPSGRREGERGGGKDRASWRPGNTHGRGRTWAPVCRPAGPQSGRRIRRRPLTPGLGPTHMPPASRACPFGPRTRTCPPSAAFTGGG